MDCGPPRKRRRACLLHDREPLPLVRHDEVARERADEYDVVDRRRLPFPGKGDPLGPDADRYTVTADFIRTMRIPILRGRGFTEAEAADSNARVAIVTEKDKDGLDILRHSTAHLLAYAVKELFPDAQVTIGPVIENGFYYDFSYKRPFTPDDLQAIEQGKVLFRVEE